MWMSTKNPTTSVSYAIFSPFNRPHEVAQTVGQLTDVSNGVQRCAESRPGAELMRTGSASPRALLAASVQPSRDRAGS